MMFEGIINLYRYYFQKNNGKLEKANSLTLFSFDGNTITVNGDLEIKIDGNLKIKTEKHMVLKTSKLPSNDEYDVYSIHLNPKDESYKEIGNNE